MPTALPAIPPAYRFGLFELRSTERVLLRQGDVVPLGSRVLQVLLALVSYPGELLPPGTPRDSSDGGPQLAPPPPPPPRPGRKPTQSA